MQHATGVFLGGERRILKTSSFSPAVEHAAGRRRFFLLEKADVNKNLFVFVLWSMPQALFFEGKRASYSRNSP